MVVQKVSEDKLKECKDFINEYMNKNNFLEEELRKSALLKGFSKDLVDEAFGEIINSIFTSSFNND